MSLYRADRKACNRCEQQLLKKARRSEGETRCISIRVAERYSHVSPGGCAGNGDVGSHLLFGDKEPGEPVCRRVSLSEGVVRVRLAEQH